MAYNPNIYNPYGMQMQQQNMMQQQPVNGLVEISGIEGAQMYQLPPNSVSPPLFLSSENAFFIKRTDGGGAATLTKYSFKEEPAVSNVNPEYVTKADFEAFASEVKEMLNGKHTLPESEQRKQQR